MKYISTIKQIKKYQRALRKWGTDFDKEMANWIRRGGGLGKGGKWDYSKREYTVLKKPVQGPEPEPKEFGLTDDEFCVKNMAEIREQAFA